MNTQILNTMKTTLYTNLTAVLCILALSLSAISHAQVRAQKVGDSPTIINADAALEIESTNKGVLLPRLALTGTTAASPLSAHVQGMLVYNTATAGTAPNDVTPGLYQNDGTAWVRIVSGAITLDGNHAAGTVAGNKPTTTPPMPTSANLPASPINGDTVTEVYEDVVVVYSYNGSAWTSVEFGLGAAPGTADHNTLRWDATNSAWEETSILTTDDDATNPTVTVTGTHTVSGTFRRTGAVYGNVRTHGDATPVVWTDDDYMVVLTNVGITGNLLLPEATAAQTGRIIGIRNDVGQSIFFADGSATTAGDHPNDFASIWSRVGALFMCDGTRWHVLAGR